MSDAFYGNVALLLHGDGENGSAAVTDVSVSPKTITGAASAGISTEQSKFGGSSIKLPNDASYLQADGSSDFAFGTGDFTIEFWFRFLNVDSMHTLYASAASGVSSGNYPTILMGNNVVGKLQYNAGINLLIQGTTDVTTDTWYHIAVSRVSSSTRLFLNGTQEGSTLSDTRDYLVGVSAPYIGGYPPGLGEFGAEGYYDEIRVTKGVGRYTGNFTPPTEAFYSPYRASITGTSTVSALPSAATHLRVAHHKTGSSNVLVRPISGMHIEQRLALVGSTTVSVTPSSGMHVPVAYSVTGAMTTEVIPSSGMHVPVAYSITGSEAITAIILGSNLKYYHPPIIGNIPINVTPAATNLTKYHRSSVIGQCSVAVLPSSNTASAKHINCELTFPEPALSATMHAETLHITGGFIETSLSASTGWTAAGGFLDTTLSSTGTLIETMKVNTSFVETSLSASVTVDERITAGLGFISSTLTSLGGWSATGDFPVFGLTSTATVDSNRINIAGEFLTTSLAFSATLEERITVAAGFIDTYLSYGSITGDFISTSLSASMSESITMAVAYVMNVHTGESSQYSNYPFMHIVHIGGKPYGVKSDGLYLLEGATDSGTAINGTITTKETDFGNFQSKRVEAIYLNSDTATTMTPTVDGTLIAASYPSGFGGRRIIVARGLEGRYWKFKFDGIKKLDGLEISTLSRQRRIK